MFLYELRRILRSRVFIIVMLLSLAYFAYMTVNFYRYAGANIKDTRQTSAEINAFLDGVTTGQQGGESLLKTLRRELQETADEFAVEAALHENDPRNPDGSRDLSPKEMELHSRQYMLLKSIDLISYQFVEYPELVKNTITKAVKLCNDPSQSDYVRRVNELAVEKYNTVKEFSLLDATPVERWYETYIDLYEYVFIVLVFAFLFVAADTFCFENSHDMEGMVFTSKYGRRRLFSGKLSALISIAFVTMLLFTVYEVCAAYYCMGGKLLLEPLQVLKAYQSSTANFSILTFIILNDILRFVLIVFTVALAGAVSQISRKVFISIIIDSIIMFLMTAAYLYASGYMMQSEIGSAETVFSAERFSLFEKLRSFLPTCLVKPFAYFEKFDYINVADYPFARLTTCLTVTIGLSVIFVLFALFRFGYVLKFIPHRTKGVAKVKES